MGDPATVICVYRVKSGNEDEFIQLLERHWPAMRELGLATDEPSIVYRGREHKDESKGTIFFEIFTWKDGETGPQTAHQTPEVMAIWEPMGNLVEERGGKPAMEFPHVERLPMSFDGAS